MIKYNKSRIILRDILLIALFVVLGAVFFSAVFPLIQIITLKGYVPIPSLIFKPIIAILLLSLLILNGNVVLKRSITYISLCILILYLMLSVIISSITKSGDIYGVLNSYNSYYFYFLIAILFLCLKQSKKTVLYMWVIFGTLFAICFILAIKQFLTGVIPVPVQSLDGNFKILSYDFYGKNRFFGLASSPLDMGTIATFFSMTFLWGFFKRKQLYWLIFCIFSIFMTYLTFTRVTYIQLFISLIFLIIYIKSKRNNIILYLYPIMAAISSYMVVFYKFTSQSGTINNSILANGTLDQRYSNWITMLDLWRNSSDIQYFFGLGISQSLDVLIDNTYIALLVHIGLVGALIVIITMYTMWKYMLDRIKPTSSFLSFGLLACWSSVFSAANFNIVFVNFAIMFCLFVILEGGYENNT